MKSIFDGWTKKIEGRGMDGEGGYCAYGWVSCAGNGTIMQLERIGKWIQRNLDPPEKWRHVMDKRPLHQPSTNAFDAVVWANNECKLDIEGFKMVDLLTQGFVPEDAPTTEDEAMHEMWLREAGRG